jgi:S1-C subfamily serine protease
VDRMGFRPGDLLTAVNGIPARDLIANQKSLEQQNRLELVIMRKSKKMNLSVEVK